MGQKRRFRTAAHSDSAQEPPRDAAMRPALAARRFVVPANSSKRGPAFTFPDTLSRSTDVVVIEDERLLQRNFRGWVTGEIAAGRSPVLAIVEDGYPVSVCFCARRSDAAAEAGLETAARFRGNGLGPCVTAAWALAIRATGRVPLCSTAWTNNASLSVARKLGLGVCRYLESFGLTLVSARQSRCPRYQWQFCIPQKF